MIMRRFFNLVCFVALGLSLARPARAFSLLGPFESWQTVDIGYQLTAGVDIGGPMNLGDEYRWNIPLITYGFDQSFLNYFGARGVAEVQKAFAILNGLPRFSQMSQDLHEYAFDTRRFNYQANALFIADVKSYTLTLMLEQLGLSPAERFVWTLRARHVINNIPEYSVIMRNFDPVTLQPSAYVNGILYTYQIMHTYANPDVWEAVEVPVDPTLPNVTSVSGLQIDGGTVDALGYLVDLEPGMFFTGLTRDDVGGLRYIYTAANLNVETLGTNVTLATGFGGGTLTSGGGGSSPWGMPPGLNQTNLATSTTNTLATTTTTNAGPVSAALRAGIDKLNFVQVSFDSTLGGWTPLTNTYTDTFITNNSSVSQTVQRVLLRPDITFAAADLGVGTGTPVPIFYSRTVSFQNNSAVNGIGADAAGPGQLNPGTTIIFSKVGPNLINIPEGSQLTGNIMVFWGSYDGTTTAPVVYPSGTSLQELERLVVSGNLNAGPNPWGPPP